ncbi:hypothetical protein [Acinetobacter lactucae]|uniref:hypothetical protein n=2 Tax=Acinetobacter lactucae TaxID=1785128 RepID=UPI001580047C|nr:hypothetical protein [Acinetobacter lactucae]NUF17431.1 hypothetical protein [Acinetobacter lactucae]
MRNFLVTIFTLLVGTSIYAGPATKSLLEQTQCEKAVELHGFLSRAQLDCTYHYYSEELKDAATKCTKHELGDKYGREVMKFGMKQFEERKKEDTKGQLCSRVLKDFPQYIKK